MSERQDVEGVAVQVEDNAVIARPQSNGARTSHRHYVAYAAQRVCVQRVGDLLLILGPGLSKALAAFGPSRSTMVFLSNNIV